MQLTVRQMRELLGASQTSFGDRYGIPMRSIQNWENGERSCPDYVLRLLQRCVLEDYEEENGHIANYFIEAKDTKAIYDTHLDESDDLEDAKKKAKMWVDRGYQVELVNGIEFLTGSYTPIDF